MMAACSTLSRSRLGPRVSTAAANNIRGIGRLLMGWPAACAKARRIEELFGDVMAESKAMLALCRERDI